MSQHSITVGIDVGDCHSHLRLPETRRVEGVPVPHGATSSEVFKRCCSVGGPMRLVVEAGNHPS